MEKPRPFRPDKPWPTAYEAGRSIAYMIAIVAGGQYFVAGLESFVAGFPRAAAWWITGLAVVLATLKIESYFARRRRLGR